MEKRPRLDRNINAEDFKEFYWLKEELLDFCREEGLKRQGSKIELAERIEEYLKTGKKGITSNVKQAKSTSRFDWACEKLTLETVITDNYTSTDNVREFFTEQIGKRFKFNVEFMSWMKTHHGKKLRDAVEEWKEIELEKKNRKDPKDIAPQFEYNRYIRDFLADNPGATRESAIACWKIKRSMRGDNVYRRSDLKFIEKV